MNSSKFKSLFILIFFIIFNSINADDFRVLWSRKLDNLRVFIENKGQIENIKKEEVLFAYLGCGNEKYYLTKKGFIIEIDTVISKRSLLAFFKKEEEEEYKNFKKKKIYIIAEWLNSNPNPKIEAYEEEEGYYTFTDFKEKCRAYKRVLYKDVYPHIDIEYYIPAGDSGGMKYNIILHKNSDIDEVKLKYSGDIIKIEKSTRGDVVIKTELHNIIDHFPICSDGLNCYTELKNNIVSFGLNGEIGEKVVVDPWVSGINIGEDFAYDVDYDFNLNLYAYVRVNYGGLYVCKFSSTGSLIWTHVVTGAIEYDGNFIVDRIAEKIYISEGFNSGGARAYRIDLNGIPDGFWSQQVGTFREMWDMIFDCSNNRIIGVGGGTNSNLNGGLINSATGSVQIANFTGFTGTCQDIVNGVVDNQGQVFVVFAKSTATPASDHKLLLLNNTFDGHIWMVNHGMLGFHECSQHYFGQPCYVQNSNAFNALAVNDNYLYYYDGLGLAVFSKNNGQKLFETNVQGHVHKKQGGIAVDDCDNIYIGGNNGNILYYKYTGSGVTPPVNVNLNWPNVPDPSIGKVIWDIKYDRNSNLLFISGYEGVAVVYAGPSANCVINTISYEVSCTGNQIGNISITVNTTLPSPSINYYLMDLNYSIINENLNASSLSHTFYNIPNGNYIIKVHINPLCGPVFIDTVTIECPSCSGDVITEDVKCYGGNDGKATVILNEITPPYEIFWNNGNNSLQAENLTAGNYSVTIIDANNCSIELTFQINQPPQLEAEIICKNSLCYNINDGVVSVYPNGGVPPYNIIWNDNQTSFILTSLNEGNYVATITDNNGCIKTVECSINMPEVLEIHVVSGEDAICLNEETELQAYGADYYGWTPSDYLSSDTGSVVVFNGLEAGVFVYTVTGYVPIIGNNLIYNGDFEWGYLGFISDYQINCNNIADGEICISSNPSNVNNGFSVCTDYTEEGTNMLVVNGSVELNKRVWCQEVKVKPYETYLFTFWATSLNDLNPANLYVTFNDNIIGTSFTLSSQPCDWQQYLIFWTNEADTLVNVCIINGNNTYDGNDFAIDDIFMGLVYYCVNEDSIQIVVNSLPEPIIVGNDSICQGESNVLTASGGVYYMWNNGVNGPINNVLPLQDTTYTVTVTNEFGCKSSTSFVVYVLPYPQVNGGVDTAFCGLEGWLNAVPSYGVGYWSSLQANVQISDTTVPNPTVSVPITGYYYFVWTEDYYGCISRDTVKILFTKVPTSDFVSTDVKCYGDTVVVMYSGEYEGQAEFNWNWGDGISFPGSGPGPHIVFWENPGNHTISLVVEVNNCQSPITSYNYIVPPPLSLTLLPTHNLCYNDSLGAINTNVEGGTPPYSYFWNTYDTTQNVINLSAGIYSVTIKDNHNCLITGSVEIQQPPKLIINVTPSQFLCYGFSTTINITANGGTPPYTYYVNNETTSPSIFVSPDSTTTYNVYVIDYNNCKSDEISTTVYVSSPINIKLISNKEKVCPGEPVMISSIISGGVGPPYLIYDEEGEIKIMPEIIYVNEPTNYTVIVEDACGSKSKGTIFIDTYPMPPINIVSDTVQGCAPLVVHFNEISADTAVQYIWDFGDNSNLSLDRNPVHTYYEGGIYDVSITVISKDNCKFTKTYNDFIKVWEKPYASFTWQPEEIDELKNEVQFINTSVGGSYYYWDFGDGNTSILKNPIHRYKKEGIYEISLIVINQKQCKDTAIEVIKVKPIYTFYAPTAFTPNGDDVNDYFYVLARGIKSEGFLLEIYDRWGEVIWSTDKYYEELERSDLWYGQIKDSENLAPVGTYVWKAVFYLKNGSKKEEVGYVTLIR